MNTMRVDFPYLMADKDRHGNDRLYVRRAKRKIRIRETPGSPGFALAYATALDTLSRPTGQKARIPVSIAPAGTLGWLAAEYFRVGMPVKLAAKSKAARRSTIEDCLREPRKPGAADLMALCPLSKLGPEHVAMLQERKADLPGAANNRHKHLSAMFTWAVKKGHLKFNPARDVKPEQYPSDGFHTWTIAEIRQFVEHHRVGSKAVLALAILLLLGDRRQDVVQFGRQHVKDGWIKFVPKKTEHIRRTPIEKPILPELARIIAASPCGDMTYLVTEYGQPFTANGFGNWFRKRCNEAKLPHCTAHGLRKAAATLAAEAGATDRQLMAMFGWTSSSQATTYTAAADRKRMAGDGMKLLQGATAELPHFGDGAPPKTKSLG